MSIISIKVELKATRTKEKIFHKIDFPFEISSLCIIDQTGVFSLKDEENNIFSDTVIIHQSFALLCFQAPKSGIYRVRLKGFDINLQEIVVVELVGKCYNAKLRKGILFFLVSASMFASFWLHSEKDWLFSFASEERKNIVLDSAKIILVVGSTEKYIDSDMLLIRFQRYYRVKVDCDTYSHKPLKELYRLLNEGKISCVVTPISNVDTLSIYWSEVYAIDNIGGNGLRLGVLKTESNIELIRQFNQ